MKTSFLTLALAALYLFGASPPALADGGNGGPRGGFFDKSKKLLKAAVTELADEIKYARPAAFAELPPPWHGQGWSQQRLEQLVRGTRSQYLVEKARPNAEGELEPLIYDFGVDEKGPYIAALKLFFVSYQSSSIHASKDEVKLDLLHEFFHHLGYDDGPARDWAWHLQNKLRQHQLKEFERSPDPRQAIWNALPATRSEEELKRIFPDGRKLCAGSQCYKVSAKSRKLGTDYGDLCPTDDGYLDCDDARRGRTDSYFDRYFRVMDDGTVLLRERGTGTSVAGWAELKGEYRFYHLR
jgi:hypothetical protein